MLKRITFTLIANSAQRQSLNLRSANRRQAEILKLSSPQAVFTRVGFLFWSGAAAVRRWSCAVGGRRYPCIRARCTTHVSPQRLKEEQYLFLAPDWVSGVLLANSDPGKMCKEIEMTRSIGLGLGLG